MLAHAAPRLVLATRRLGCFSAFVTETADGALAALMAAAQNGDARAYRALLRAVLPIAAATIRRQGVPADRVDDVVQDVLLTIHRARATYDPSRPFLPWLRAIAQRRAVDALRTHLRTAARELFDEDANLNHPGTSPDADDALNRSDAARRLREAVATLPPASARPSSCSGLHETRWKKRPTRPVEPRVP